MIVLGLSDGVPGGAAILKDGVVAAVADEAAEARVPIARGIPRRALSRVFERAGVTAREVDLVMVDGIDRSPVNRLRADAGCRPRPTGSLSFALRPVHAWRRRMIRSVLNEEFAVTAPAEFVHHHQTRAAGAYFTSGFVDALVVTMDGGGDGDLVHVYDVREGHFRQIGGASINDRDFGARASDPELLADFVGRHLEGNKPGDLVLAGERFADPSVHRRLARLSGIDEVFVPPADLVSAPALGAALAACLANRKDRRSPFARSHGLGAVTSEDAPAPSAP